MGLQNKFVTLPPKYKDEETTKTHISVISNERNIVKNQVKATNVNGVHTQKCSAETRRRTFLCDQGVLEALPLTRGARFS